MVEEMQNQTLLDNGQLKFAFSLVCKIIGLISALIIKERPRPVIRFIHYNPFSTKKNHYKNSTIGLFL